MRVLPAIGNRNKNELVDYVRENQIPIEGNPMNMTMIALRAAASSHDEALFTSASANERSAPRVTLP